MFKDYVYFFTGKQPRRQPVIAPSEAFTKGFSKALAKVYPYELEHIVSYFEAGMKLGQMQNIRNQTLSKIFCRDLRNNETELKILHKRCASLCSKTAVLFSGCYVNPEAEIIFSDRLFFLEAGSGSALKSKFIIFRAVDAHNGGLEAQNRTLEGL